MAEKDFLPEVSSRCPLNPLRIRMLLMGEAPVSAQRTGANQGHTLSRIAHLTPRDIIISNCIVFSFPCGIGNFPSRRSVPAYVQPQVSSVQANEKEKVFLKIWAQMS
jgi:hypothetical protein